MCHFSMSQQSHVLPKFLNAFQHSFFSSAVKRSLIGQCWLASGSSWRWSTFMQPTDLNTPGAGRVLGNAHLKEMKNNSICCWDLSELYLFER